GAARAFTAPGRAAALARSRGGAAGARGRLVRTGSGSAGGGARAARALHAARLLARCAARARPLAAASGAGARPGLAERPSRARARRRAFGADRVGCHLAAPAGRGGTGRLRAGLASSAAVGFTVRAVARAAPPERARAAEPRCARSRTLAGRDGPRADALLPRSAGGAPPADRVRGRCARREILEAGSGDGSR